MHKNIDHMPDDVFVSVTEAMAIAGETLETGATNSLLIITLAEDENMAVLGGDTSPAALNQLRNLLNAICERSVESPEVLRITA